MKTVRIALLGCLLGAAWPWVGCAPSAGSDFYSNIQSADAQFRIGAIVQASRVKDPNMLPYLVDRLTDSESDVRLFAATALKEITGRSMGYEIYETPQVRAQRQQQWRQWLAAGRPASMPSTLPAATAAMEGGIH